MSGTGHVVVGCQCVWRSSQRARRSLRKCSAHHAAQLHRNGCPIRSNSWRTKFQHWVLPRVHVRKVTCLLRRVTITMLQDATVHNPFGAMIKPTFEQGLEGLRNTVFQKKPHLSGHSDTDRTRRTTTCMVQTLGELLIGQVVFLRRVGLGSVCVCLDISQRAAQGVRLEARVSWEHRMCPY